MMSSPIQPFNKHMNRAAARQPNLLEILLFADAKFKHLWLPRFDHLHSRMHNRWLNTTTTDRTRQLPALTNSQLRARPAWGRSIHRYHHGNSYSFPPLTPPLYIRQNVTHQISPSHEMYGRGLP